MKEKVEIPEEYVELIKNARNTPIIMIDVAKQEIKDYEKLADVDKEIRNIKISKAIKIKYYGNGHIDVYYAYNEKPITYSIIKNSSCFEQLQNTIPDVARAVGISREKIKDVKKLLNH
ncbi:uncharacterized protein LOC127288955 isoform X2 [Leptopilina boulardi]|nr:uncharacterized protein LOC127288955 isoform X2 [Leptopilina boulardi]